ncbi:branched-chain amino acid aminotransferase [Trypanosoma rangeli SC58]|uniref:Branched-chain amino acid aminotransferase n=1 Tax=Trypanosoma rangeli SC58 TaxID=429131 RepID=A0A061IUS0_TRYRA|nr:branched-chain amino acid aminotransferase [Trypanosoma rangeli SC58]
MSFQARCLTVQRVTNPPPLPPLKGVKFGSIFTPHMVKIEWQSLAKWGNPRIVPFENLSLPPQTACLHYALECFEGLKAYRDAAGRVRLFRPERNCARMLESTTRLCFPKFDPNELLKIVEEFVKVERTTCPPNGGIPSICGRLPLLLATLFPSSLRIRFCCL